MEIERIRESRSRGQYPQSRHTKSYNLERQVEPLVMASEISGLADRHGYLKSGNLVVRMSFPYIELPSRQPAYIERAVKIEPPQLKEKSPAPVSTAMRKQKIEPQPQEVAQTQLQAVKRAAAWVAKYIREARPQLATDPDDGTLFLTNTGEEINRDHLTWMVRSYVVRAKIGKTGACHLFRHTMATLMLEGGADIRFIQQMLGHAELSTTEIYTHVSIRMLKQVHTATHPAASLGPDSAPPVPAHPEEPESDAETLFATLDAEAEEEQEE